MSELIKIHENTKQLCDYIKSLPDLNEIKLGNAKLSSEQAMTLRRYRNDIPNLMANKVWLNMKLNYAFSNREAEFQEMQKSEVAKEAFKIKAYGLANQLWEIPLKAIDAVFAQSRKFSEFPSATSLLKSWNAIKGDYADSERTIIRAYLTKRDNLSNVENTKVSMFKYFREVGLIKD